MEWLDIIVRLGAAIVQADVSCVIQDVPSHGQLLAHRLRFAVGAEHRWRSRLCITRLGNLPGR